VSRGRGGPFSTTIPTWRVSFEAARFMVLNEAPTCFAVFFITRRVSEGLVTHVAATGPAIERRAGMWLGNSAQRKLGPSGSLAFAAKAGLFNRRSVRGLRSEPCRLPFAATL
jgi:hypothetical protein